ncbi:MAG: diguanylate cyclase [Candidatus Thiodiazotropha sp.]|nr:diguanylate cyclase [Candidatus Thiodiazotropha sp.]MCM8921237.1 diguanylate cyclase [Candidatus Thiodiazotropha sp.]
MLGFGILFILLFSVFCVKAAGTINPVDYTEYLLDLDQKLQVDSLHESDLTTKFEPLAKVKMYSVYSDAVHWFRLSPPPGEWLLEIAYPLLDHVALFKSNGNGGFDASYAGDTRPFSDREIPYHNPLFHLNQSGNDYFYLRIQTEGSAQIPLMIWSPFEFTENSVKNGQLFGLYFGAMLVMVLYNLFLYFSVRDINYLYYIIYICTFLLFQGSLSGYTFQYLWPESPVWGTKATAFFVGVVVIAAIQFSRQFLQTWEHAPLLDKLMRILNGAGILCMLLAILAPYPIAALYANSMGVLLVLVVLPTGYVVFFRGYRPARFFIIAWTTFLIGIFINALMLAGVVPLNTITVNAMPAGSFIEVVLLSLALADRINRLRQYKETAQVRYNHELQVINQTLEQRVERRTYDLNKAKEQAEAVNYVLAEKNRELAQMASHDMLTDLLNRRAFRDYATQMLADGVRNSYPLSIVMIDLDHFKQINDKFGHQVGDQVLIDFGEMLKISSRTSDQVARYGGEEFILLLSHTDLDSAMQKAEKLRNLLAEHEFNYLSGLTINASFGVCSTEQGSVELDKLISMADMALYEAKHQGRNQVYLAT